MNRFLFCFLICFSAFSQKQIEVPSISDDLRKNASHVVVQADVLVDIISGSLFNVKEKRIVVVYNKEGLQALNFREYYSSNTKIKKIQVFSYGQTGGLIQSFKQKDFKDYSLSSGMSITDTRVLELDFRTNQFPVILVYESEIESKNTAFLPKWYPIDTYGKSIVNSTFTIQGMDQIKVSSKLYNSSFFPIEQQSQSNTVTYSLENFPALTHEPMAPSDPRLFLPYVLSAAENIRLEGVTGSFTNWQELGDWYYNEFIKGTETLPAIEQQKVKDLVVGIEDPIEKAKILYQYMQGRTRYISIQLGIGGWRPMLAKDVSMLGYGDCKALTNYFRALLEVVGVRSYPVILTGSNSPIDLQAESVCLQGNHMILAIPTLQGYQWVECTSQTTPFGHIAGFTDNRTVLVVKDTGSELVRTKKYTLDENVQNSSMTYDLQDNGDVSIDLQINSSGTQLDNRFFVLSLDTKAKDRFYRNRFDDFKSLSFNIMDMTLDTVNQRLYEHISFTSPKYAAKLGNRLVLSLATWNGYPNIFRSYQQRRLPVFLNSDWKDIDQVELLLPEGYALDFAPEKLHVESEFGSYKVSLTQDKDKVFYKRELTVKGGLISNQDYESYKEFRENIASKDQIKIVIKKSSN